LDSSFNERSKDIRCLASKINKVGTGCKEAGEKNYVGNISGNLQHL
jgi:hypothetical protein